MEPAPESRLRRAFLHLSCSLCTISQVIRTSLLVRLRRTLDAPMGAHRGEDSFGVGFERGDVEPCLEAFGVFLSTRRAVTAANERRPVHPGWRSSRWIFRRPRAAPTQAPPRWRKPKPDAAPPSRPTASSRARSCRPRRQPRARRPQGGRAAFSTWSPSSTGRAGRFCRGASPIRWTRRSALPRSTTLWRGTASRRFSTPIVNG